MPVLPQTQSDETLRSQGGDIMPVWEHNTSPGFRELCEITCGLTIYCQFVIAQGMGSVIMMITNEILLVLLLAMYALAVAARNPRIPRFLLCCIARITLLV